MFLHFLCRLQLSDLFISMAFSASVVEPDQPALSNYDLYLKSKLALKEFQDFQRKLFSPL